MLKASTHTRFLSITVVRRITFLQYVEGEHSHTILVDDLRKKNNISTAPKYSVTPAQRGTKANCLGKFEIDVNPAMSKLSTYE